MHDITKASHLLVLIPCQLYFNLLNLFLFLCYFFFFIYLFTAFHGLSYDELFVLMEILDTMKVETMWLCYSSDFLFT